jgi:hypothetical protein
LGLGPRSAYGIFLWVFGELRNFALRKHENIGDLLFFWRIYTHNGSGVGQSDYYCLLFRLQLFTTCSFALAWLDKSYLLYSTFTICVPMGADKESASLSDWDLDGTNLTTVHDLASKEGRVPENRRLHKPLAELVFTIRVG